MLAAIVGKPHVLMSPRATRRYRTGYRFGTGRVLAVVCPGSLFELWRVVQACVDANVIVLPQAANTGLTGGSTPDGDAYDREIVIISMRRMDVIHVLDGGKQVICLPGATLHHLERVLKPLGRAPHSEIGSSCIGASVIGGVCNNSGGALLRRGPAYTEMSMFAQVDARGMLQLVNHLGMQLRGSEEDMLGQLQRGSFGPADVQYPQIAASDRHYAEHVRDVDADTPARYNADSRRLYEASGSAGKVVVFAVRLDTFALERGARVFYIGTRRAEDLTQIRRKVLRGFQHLPIAGEYLHRDAFDIAHRYGKDVFLMVRWFGTRRLPALFALKGRVDAFCSRVKWGPSHLSDRVLQAMSRLFPNHLPRKMMDFRHRFEHHLLLKVTAEGVEEARALLSEYFATASGAYFECTEEEGDKAFLHRFTAAGAATRYRAIHSEEVEDIVALDVALRRNDLQWFESLPPEIEAAIQKKLYYGHFMCHVFHQDYIVKKGHDCLALEHRMWKLLDGRGAEYPAEHNVGHLYEAKPVLKTFYRKLDPCNCFNAGVGKMSKFFRYKDTEAVAGTMQSDSIAAGPAGQRASGN